MTNLYNAPAQADFINTYTPVPFDTILQAGLMKEQQYNAGAKAGDEIFDKFKALDVAQPDISEKNARLYTIQNDISNMMDKYKDLGSTEFQRELERYKNNITRDEWWSTAVSNKPVYEKLMTSYLENKQKNKAYNYGKQLNTVENFNKYGTKGLISTGQNYLQDPGATGYADFNKSIEETMKNVKADGYDIENYDNDTGLFKIKKGREEVAYEKLVNAANVNYGAFLASTEGENFKNYAVDMLQRNGEDVTAENLKKVYDYTIANKAQQFVWKKTNDGIDFDAGLASYMKQKEEDERIPATFTGDAEHSDKTVDYSKADDLTDVSTRNPMGYLTSSASYTGKKLAHPELSANVDYIVKTYNVSRQEAKQMLNSASNYWLAPSFKRYNVIKQKDMSRMQAIYDRHVLNAAFKMYDENGIEIPVEDRRDGNYKIESVGSFSLSTGVPSESGIFSAIAVDKKGNRFPVKLTLPDEIRGVGASAKFVDDAISESVLSMKPTTKQIEIGQDQKMSVTVDPGRTYDNKKKQMYFQPKIYINGNKKPYSPEEWKKLVEQSMYSGINSIQ